MSVRQLEDVLSGLEDCLELSFCVLNLEIRLVFFTFLMAMGGGYLFMLELE